MEKFTIYFMNSSQKGFKDGYVKYFDESNGDIVLTNMKKECLPFPDEKSCRQVLAKIRNANKDINIRYVPLKYVV